MIFLSDIIIIPVALYVTSYGQMIQYQIGASLAQVMAWNQGARPLPEPVDWLYNSSMIQHYTSVPMSTTIAWVKVFNLMTKIQSQQLKFSSPFLL